MTVEGGVMPYIYSWTGTDYMGNSFSSTDEDLSGLKAGTYTLTVTDGNNCIATMPSFNITQPPSLTVTIDATTNVLCHDAATGAIYVTVSGGSACRRIYLFLDGPGLYRSCLFRFHTRSFRLKSRNV